MYENAKITKQDDEGWVIDYKSKRKKFLLFLSSLVFQ